MKVKVLALVGLLLPIVLIPAESADHEHDHHMVDQRSPGDSLIQVTINPEARVSVKLIGDPPSIALCGSPAELTVKIVNEGFVTARLEAQFVGDPPSGVGIDFSPEPVKGIPEEVRSLHLKLTEPGPTDLTIALKAHNEIPDLGGRNRLHFLMLCLPEVEYARAVHAMARAIHPEAGSGHAMDSEAAVR